MSAERAKSVGVLLLENDSLDAELCVRALQRGGLEVRADFAQTPDEFRLKIAQGSYDVILADYNLPCWTGLEAFDHSRGQGCVTPFILVTGAVGDEVAVECIKRGISDYVLKDRLARLPMAVERALEEKSLREERANAERLAWAKERRFLSLIEHSADAIVLLNARGAVIFSSRAERRILGYTPEKRAGADFFELVHPDDAPRSACAFTRLRGRSGARESIEFRYQSSDGSWRWIECILTNLLDEPAVEGVVVNYRDISERKEAEEEILRLNRELERRVAERTAQLESANAGLQAEIAERKRAEKVLRDSQERFRLVVEGVREYAIYMLDPQGRIASWNAGAERIEGYRAEEIVGRHVSCFYTREDSERGLPAQDLCVAATEGKLEAERLEVRKGGSTFRASTVLTALHSPSGRLRGFSRVTRDVTEQRRAYEALERLGLQQQLILNSAGDGIFGLDESGACTFANPAGARMAGSKPEELKGQLLSEYFVRPRSADGALDRSTSAIKAALGDGRTYNINGEVLLRRDGGAVAVDYVVTPMRSETGRVLGAVVTFHDVTARRAVEKMKDEFISVVSHEVRTPLTAIRAALGLLESGQLCQAERQCRSMIKVGVESADRLIRLVSDILDLERIESGKATIEAQPCEASGLLRRAVDLMRVTAESREIKLQADSARVLLSADSDRIMQVLVNLVSNAIKFSPPGSTIRIAAVEDGDNVVFQVCDQGRGIPAAKLSQVFERFEQVDAADSREKGGTGLGLAISKSIIAQHGGRIWAESTLAKGSTFFFSLPIRPGPESAVLKEVSDAQDNPCN
ncbi:MAG: PAS domain S-box protein [Terriglobia bacterium]